MLNQIKIGKRGSDLAFRIPIALVRKFYLKVGDEIDSRVIEGAILETRRLQAEAQLKS